MMVSGVLFDSFLVLLLYSTSPVLCTSFPHVRSGPASSLNTTLRKFANTRHHRTNPKGKEDARELIKKTFKEAGLVVWAEAAVLNDNGIFNGENIVGMLKGSRRGTAADKIVIVGAHYDTVANTTGVDDNGSGMTALLEVAKQIGNVRCQLNNTIIFVAFDFQEDGLIGSKQFVKNFTKYVNGTGAEVNGALILETVINHNSSAGSQTLLHGSELFIPEVKEVQRDSMRGNFLAVVGRREPDKKLLTLIKKHFEADSDYRAQLAPIPLTGKPRDSPLLTQYLRGFYRSDHFSFWQNDISFSALMLTDTADFRGYMRTCYHKKCDDLRPVKDDDLEFLRRTINAVIQTTLELSGTCEQSSTQGPTDAAASSVLIDVVFLLLVVFTSCVAAKS